MINHNCVIEKDVVVGAGSYIDSYCILKSGTRIGDSTYIGAGCIAGEKQVVKKEDAFTSEHEILSIGHEAVIRSGSILYSGSSIGNCFQTGHRVTIREKSQLGDHVSVGTLSDIQGHCHIGNYVRLHSNVHIGQKSRIEDFVWIFPYAVLTNDPTPPSELLKGVHIASFAVIAAGAVILPGISIGRDALIGAGAVVTKNVGQYEAVAGNPAKVLSDVRKIKDRDTGRDVYPWRYHFSRGMPWADCGYDVWEASERTRMKDAAAEQGQECSIKDKIGNKKHEEKEN